MKRRIVFFYLLIFSYIAPIQSSNAQMTFFSSWQARDLRLTFTTTAQTVFNKNCSASVSVRTGIGTSFPINVEAPLFVNLSSSSGTMEFFSDESCTTSVAAVTISTGSNTSSFYFRDSAVTGATTLTASAAGYLDATQAATLTSNPFLWTGATSSVWSLGANWSGLTAPSSGNIAVFDGGCVNCNPTFTAHVNVRGLRLDSGYSGTIQQDTTYNFTIGASGYVQVAGTFAGSTAASRTFSVFDGRSTIAGGSFTTPAGTLTVTNGWRILGSPTFLARAGSTLNLECMSTGYDCNGGGVDYVSGTVVYENVAIKGLSFINLKSSVWTVDGDLTIGDPNGSNRPVYNGRFNVKGDVIASGQGNRGDAIINLVGSPAGQTIIGGNIGLPFIEINAGIHPVTLSGIVKASSYAFYSAGVFTTAGSTLVIGCLESNSSNCTEVKNIVPGTVTYNNVTFQTYRDFFELGGGIFNIDGNLLISTTGGANYGRINTGTLKVKGNVSNAGTGGDGSAVIELIGNPLGQTLSGIVGAIYPYIEIATGGNDVTLSGFIRVQGWTVTSIDELTATGSTLNITCLSTNVSCYSSAVPLVPGTVNYNNVTISGLRTGYNLGGGTFNVTGDFTFGGQDSQAASNYLANGTINVTGQQIIQNNFGMRGSAVIKVAGHASGQTITGNSQMFPIIEIDAGLNNVTLSGGIYAIGWRMTTVGTFTTTGSTLQFRCPTSVAGECFQTTVNLIPGTVTYNNVDFVGSRTNYDLGGTWNVSGNLSFGDASQNTRTLSNGILRATGDVTISNNGHIGNAQLQFVGGGSVNVSIAGGAVRPTGLITVAKTGGGSVTQTSSVSWSSTGQDMTITSGSWIQNTFSLTVNDVLTIGAGTTLNRSGATLIYGSLSNSGTLIP